MLKDKIFLFLILGLIIVLGFTLLNSSKGETAKRLFNRVKFFYPVRLMSNGVKDVVAKKEPLHSKGIYITFRTASTPRVDELLELVKRTELNTVVIDIKDCTGQIAFDTDNELINEIGSEQIWIKDIKGLVNKFHKENIYVIARIVVFEDNFLPKKRPYLALKTRNNNLWRDKRGLTWLDPAAQEVWDYNIALAKEAVKAGFDEINLDYIRFPSDGDISNIVYPHTKNFGVGVDPFPDGRTLKQEVLRQFFEYFSQRIRPLGVFISADLFGLTLTSETDMNIGQWLEDAALYFDYICPMVYPSHYPEGHDGFANPAVHPYEVIYDGLTMGIERLASVSTPAQIRPWLQDFDLGAHYDAEMVNLEKKAVYDAGAFGWLLWNPKNIYTEDALAPH